ncbi:glycosyltransferase family 4 protein [Saccharicrinis aurantiacus]|uniref:glycosyltransferase family 4 protein n=1 Tax=Saccharicrinis aurantiacus TaxID=1849719 RepID=UPI0024911E2E|nr:glycosyltransferase family 4 protein [Saccharicrinis aurantiacus]
MKIAFIITNKSEFNYTHYNNQEIGRAIEFVNKGYNVDIYVFSKKNIGSTTVYSKDNISAKIVNYKGIPFLGNQTIPINLLSILKKARYKTIFIHEYPWIIPALIALYYKTKDSEVYLMQGMYEDFNSSIKRLYNKAYDKLFAPILINKLDGVIFKTSASQQYFKNKGFLNCKNIVIPVGLDLNKFNNSNDETLSLKLRSKILSYKNRLLYVGAIEKRRNPLFLISILKALVMLNDSIVLIIVGKGPMKSQFERAIEENNLTTNIIHIRSLKQTQLPWLYSNSNFFIFPSSYEIFGMVLLEALHFKLPIISSPTAGSSEILENQRGTYIRDMDISQWVSIISKGIDDKSLYEKPCLPDRFKWNKIVESIIEFSNLHTFKDK